MWGYKLLTKTGHVNVFNILTREWSVYVISTVRMVSIKKTPSVGKDIEKREPWYTVGGNVNLCSHYGKQYGQSSKHKKHNMIQKSHL